jgi:XTP/dITP diphosphohydrolase
VTKLFIATRNRHKVEEIRAILGAQFQFLTLDDFPGAPKVIEDANTFAGNANKKAVELVRWISENSKSKTQNPKLDFVLADDSGLEVDALGGKPGVHSARFAALNRSADGSSANSPDADNNAKLLHLLKNVPAGKRTARFRCVIALVPVLKKKNENASPVCFADELESPAQLFDGACEGEIIFEPRGQNGFGYDPLFVPVGFEKTFAELGDETKNQLSHRAQALAKLKRWLDSVNK